MKKILLILALLLSGCNTTTAPKATDLQDTPEIQINSPETIQLITPKTNEASNESK